MTIPTPGVQNFHIAKFIIINGTLTKIDDNTLQNGTITTPASQRTLAFDGKFWYMNKASTTFDVWFNGAAGSWSLIRNSSFGGGISVRAIERIGNRIFAVDSSTLCEFDLRGNLIKTKAFATITNALGICSDGRHFYVFKGGAGPLLWRVDTNGNEISSFSVTGTPRGICTDGKFLYTFHNDQTGLNKESKFNKYDKRGNLIAQYQILPNGGTHTHDSVEFDGRFFYFSFTQVD